MLDLSSRASTAHSSICMESRSESLGVAALEHQRLDLMSGSVLTVLADMLEERFGGRRGMMNATFVALAVSTGVVVIVVALAVVLVVLFVTLSMRGRQMRGAQRRGEARHDDEATGRAERQRDRDIAREGREDIGPDG
jgi:uncharacterized membrane protein